MPEKKHFKIIKGTKKFGIVSNTFMELVEKCSLKFNMNKDRIVLSLEDGTEIDEEYFDVLENNEEILIKIEDSFASPILNRLEGFLSKYKDSHIKGFDDKLQEVLRIENVSQMLYSLISLNDMAECYTSDRVEDWKWFEGLNTKYKTKEDVLKNSAENRMRGYFQKLKKDLEHCKEYQAFQMLISKLQEKLKERRYHSYYFDRSDHDITLRLCDSQGLFKCHGDFQTLNCPSSHFINPYKSKEERIIFSTWNFDHVIEKSRSIIPAVRNALVKSPNILTINPEYLFELLFEHQRVSGDSVAGNLKLVHIVCHNKNPHKLECDRKFLIIDYSLEDHHRAKRMKHS